MSFQYPIYKWEQQAIYSNFWQHSQIKQQEFKLELAKKPSFANCFNKRLNLTSSFKKDIEFRTKGEIPLSLVIQIFGKQGDGKSKLSFQIAKTIDENFTSKKIFMKVEDILNYCKKAKPNDCLILDEQTINFGEGSLRQLKELQNIEEVTRIKQVHFIYNSPTLREHMAAHYTLKVLQKNLEKRLTKFAFCTNSGNSYYGWGLCYVPPDDECQVWQDYEPVKLEYAKGVLERSIQKYNLWEVSSEISTHKLFQACKGRGDLIVLAQDLYPSLTIGEHKKIVGAFLLQQRMFKLKQKKAEIA